MGNLHGQPLQIHKTTHNYSTERHTVISKIRKILQFLVEYTNDLFLFVKFNGYSPLVNANKRLYYKIIIETHTIEKGLSLNKPKLLFGREKIKFVMRMLDSYDVKYSSFPVEMALGSLDSYLRFHSMQSVADPLLDEVSEFLQRWHTIESFKLTGGTKDIQPHAGSYSNGADFLRSRASFRMFNGENLPLDLIEDIIKLAQTAPSQCNRQSSKAHLFQQRELIDSLLNYQGGSRGFSGSVGNIFLVTSEITAWGGAGQRNQPYVDGSLFAMSILLSCHAMGIAACPLNLAIPNAMEKKIKLASGIDAGEKLIMMIAFGHPVDEPLRVASSPRRDVSEILTVHTSKVTL